MVKPIMILGTCSGAGKSTVVFALCRLFQRAGFDTVPFKAQNMSNNSHILEDGRVMARSQALAAYASGKEPDVDMNPLFLTYRDGLLSVIARGRLLEGVDQKAFEAMKSDLPFQIMGAYERITKGRDIVVLEGAGSPVEMNLKDRDIVNIRMAILAKSPVILVADIDRGGAFASVYGTLMLLSEEERRLVKGIIINRIRGDAASFQEVRREMEKITGLPVVGMLPYLSIQLEDEDDLIDPLTGKKPRQGRETMELALDELADSLKEHLDMDRLYDILEGGI